MYSSSRRRHTRLQGDWSSDVCSSDLRSGQKPATCAFRHTSGETPRSLSQRRHIRPVRFGTSSRVLAEILSQPGDVPHLQALEVLRPVLLQPLEDLALLPGGLSLGGELGKAYACNPFCGNGTRSRPRCRQRYRVACVDLGRTAAVEQLLAEIPCLFDLVDLAQQPLEMKYVDLVGTEDRLPITEGHAGLVQRKTRRAIVIRCAVINQTKGFPVRRVWRPIVAEPVRAIPQMIETALQHRSGGELAAACFAERIERGRCRAPVRGGRAEQ